MQGISHGTDPVILPRHFCPDQRFRAATLAPIHVQIYSRGKRTARHKRQAEDVEVVAADRKLTHL